jgi:condensin complex subunit 1
MRIAIVEVLGHLITELVNTDADDGADKHQSQKQINGLYDLLLERIMDVSSYVRTKVLSVLSRCCDLKHKFPKQRLAITRAGTAALEDKAATVRKGAAALLVKLLLTHPYGLMHGGFLELDVWEAEYQVVKRDLAKVEDAMGKAVERNDGDEEDEEEEESEEEVEGEEGESPKRRKKKCFCFPLLAFAC